MNKYSFNKIYSGNIITNNAIKNTHIIYIPSKDKFAILSEYIEKVCYKVLDDTDYGTLTLYNYHSRDIKDNNSFIDEDSIEVLLEANKERRK